MIIHGVRTVLLGCVLSMALRVALSAAKTGQPVPWWDDFPALIQVGDPRTAVRAHACAALCGAADDPTWGIFGQRQSIVSFGKRIEELHGAGLKALTWFEGFGTCGSYIAQVKRNPDGSWVKDQRDSSVTRLFHQHWNWEAFDGTGEIRWVGPHCYFTDEEFARPWTRLHPRYGCVPMTYPDGRVSAGYRGDGGDPRNSCVLDAGCAKDVLGRVTFEYNYNASVNQLQPDTLQPRGPITGLMRVEDAPLGPPDPGFTPEQWKRLKKPGYAGDVDAGKDSACPRWGDYARASVRQALDAGIDGLWVDNYSPWDSFNAKPVLKAFGEWSVAGFRDYLRTHFSARALSGMEVENAQRFDVRQYLQARCREWGGDQGQLSDPRWYDPRWQDDPVWRAYLIYKRQTGTAALSRFYQTLKQEAATAGKPDFLVMGNDLPLFSLGWVRGDLDMVSTELTWGWHLTTGPRGIMAPPHGNYVPVYKLAREHARSRFVNLWMYVPEAQLGRTNIARVLYYQALANHALPMPFPGDRTAGNPATDADFFDFVRRMAPIFGDRVPLEEVGLYYSSSSQLMEMLPGGFRDHHRQPHSFAFWGWGTALTQLHVQWRAVPEWKLGQAVRGGLRLLIIPQAEVIEKHDAASLEAWIREGGTLIVTGSSGTRLGESDNFERVPKGSTLPVTIEDSRVAEARPRPLGKGRVLYLRRDPGFDFYLADKERAAMLSTFSRTLEALPTSGGSPALEAPGVPATVGLTLYRNGKGLFVDVNNTALDLETDTITPAMPLRFTVNLPKELRGQKLRVRVLAPEDAPGVEFVQKGSQRLEVELGAVPVFASVQIEAANQYDSN